MNSSELALVLQRFKRGFITVGVVSMFVNILMLVPALYMLQLYDRVLTSRSTETLIVLTALLVMMFIFLWLMDWVRHRIAVRLSNQLDQSLRQRGFDALYDWAQVEPDKANAMPIKDLVQLRSFMSSPGFTAFFDAPWILIYVGVLFLFHSVYGWFAVGGVIVMTILLVVTELKSRQPSREASGLQSSIQTQTAFNLRNYEVVQAMGIRGALSAQWNATQEQWLDKQTDSNDQHTNWSLLAKYLRLLLQSLILGLGGYLVILGELTAGMMIAGSIILGRALAPLDVLNGQWRNIIGTRDAYERLGKLLQSFPASRESMELPEPQTHLRLESVVYAPNGPDKAVLKGIQADVPAGQVIGIMGPSASGKTTLLRIILGVLPHYKGKVTFDGAELSQWNRSQLGPYMGYLPQDIELFNATVKDNIARLGEVDTDKVIEAAQVAGVHEMILNLPKGYDTEIGDKGVALSAGQRQRIGLARAIYGNPKLVVLDEPNSNLDEQGERALLAAIRRLKATGCSVIFVTHRLTTLKAADQIWLFKDGLIEKTTTPQEFFAQLQQRGTK